jgi:cell division protein FtsI (penicillin-binding protein 3)
METPPLATFSKSVKRLAILGLVLGGWAVVIVLRLLQLQIFEHNKYRHMADVQQEKLDEAKAPRGAILDRNGSYLAISSDVPIVCVNPLRIPDKETAAAILASVLHLDQDEVLGQIVQAAANHRGYLVVDPEASEGEVDSIRKLNLDWVDIRQGTARSYPNGQLAAHVVGKVNSLDRGVAGIEKTLNKDLSGTPGLIRVTTDVHRRGYEFEVEKAPVVGKNVTLTIDSRLQYVAEQAIAQAVEAKHAQRGSVIVVDPYTGEVLALANYPTYDLNQRLKLGEKAHGREDYAVVAPFEPGSVFKVVTLSSALETTNLRPDTIINCGGGILRIGHRIIHDDHNYSSLSMEDVLAHSSNIGAIHIGMQVGQENLYKYIRRLGFGQRTGIELPAEAPGLLRPLARWQSGSLPSISMGHEIAVTSVQLAQLGSIIANGGFLVHPHLVMYEQTPGGQKTFEEHPKPVQVLQPQTVITMRHMMERVVLMGTGTRAHIAGYTTGGKTGTAMIFDFAHHVYTHTYNATFMGFAPVTNPAIVVVATVVGTTGASGEASQAAAPTFRTVAEEALRLRGVPRDLPAEIENKRQDQLAGINRKTSEEKRQEDDDLAIADLSEPLSPEEAKASLGEPSEDGATTVLPVNAVSGPTAPNFLGKTVRDVVEQAAEQGLELETKGRGLARAQLPAPGAPLWPGRPVRVVFTHE